MKKIILLLLVLMSFSSCVSAEKISEVQKRKMLLKDDDKIKFYDSGRVKEYYLYKSSSDVTVYVFEDRDYTDEYYDKFLKAIEYDYINSLNEAKRKLDMLELYLKKESLKEHKTTMDEERIKKYSDIAKDYQNKIKILNKVVE